MHKARTIKSLTSEAAESTAKLKLFECRADQAIERASRLAPLRSGEEALREVARPDGDWDWALVGPMPSLLPLAGGGQKGPDELKHVAAQRPNTFGLLRLTFGTRKDALTKFVYIYTAEETTCEPDMCEAVGQFVDSLAARVRLLCPEDCSPECLVEAIRAAASVEEQPFLTSEMYREHLATLSQGVEDLFDDEVEKDGFGAEVDAQRSFEVMRQGSLQRLNSIKSNGMSQGRGSAVDADPVAAQRNLRKRTKLYYKGDRVEILNRKLNTWIDGEVLEVATEFCSKDDYDKPIRAGSTKILYGDGTQFRWVEPWLLEGYVRPSPRPRFPEPLADQLRVETHTVCGTFWQPAWVEVNRGFLQWRFSMDGQGLGGPEHDTSIHLLGLRQEQLGLRIRLQSHGASGAVYSLRFGTEDDATEWAEVLWVHSQYCFEEFKYFHREGGMDTEQILNSLNTNSRAFVEPVRDTAVVFKERAHPAAWIRR